jgi:transcriptional regulator with XRE-family HTH domain
MTVKITEVKKEDRATFGMRLQGLRERKPLSRRELSDLTGIPAKSIEKFEGGLMSPTIERLQELARVLETPISLLLTGEDNKGQSEQTQQQAAKVREVKLPVVNTSNFELAVAELAALDQMREAGFENWWRTAPRNFAALPPFIDALSFEELLDLAEERSLMAIPEHEIRSFSELESEDQVAAVQALVERIIDTVYFGIDLMKLKQEPLEALAAKLDMEADESPFWGDWSSYQAVISALRPRIREEAMKGNAQNFQDENSFPRVVVA